MSSKRYGPLSFAEMLALPVVVDLHTAARALDVCVSTAYRMIDAGTFPCTVLRAGYRYRVPTALLMRALGIEEHPLYAVDPETDAGVREEHCTL
ncbi:helix-turn-helix domain-containing protein [Streptomyces pinistramenti]|uniref:helix-turn-helix domain-containing protein n=1 Tax=Streptomyces pinistramenti TaxID=2884812 RepID=UPI001D080561|nr:helix-turn-helix domain-containing protein [Streptomyces pinistramenti]MCB5909662.1 helix-turn-helix domain-containing protein [Streptomyces pinistramenti]